MNDSYQTPPWNNTCRLAALLLSVSILAGCASSISKQYLAKVSYKGGFEEILNDPEKYVGKIVLMGGRIVQISASEMNSELMVLHMPLDLDHVPYNHSYSVGPYILTAARYLDPVQFEPGILLTVVARLTGSRQIKFNDKNHEIPMMHIMQIVLWEPRKKLRPNLQIIISAPDI